VLDREIDAAFASRSGQRDLADHLARLDPRGVGNRTRRVEIEDDVVVLEKAAGTVGCHHDAPGRRQRQRSFHGAAQVAHQTVGSATQRRQLHSRVIDATGFCNSDVHLVSRLDHQGPFAARLDPAQRDFLIPALCAVRRPGGVVAWKPKLAGLFRDGDAIHPGLLRNRVAEGHPLVISTERKRHDPMGSVHLPQLNLGLAVTVADGASLAIDRLPRRIVTSRRKNAGSHAVTKPAVFELQSKLRLIDDDPVPVPDAVDRAGRCTLEVLHFECNAHQTAGRTDFNRVGRSAMAHRDGYIQRTDHFADAYHSHLLPTGAMLLPASRIFGRGGGAIPAPRKNPTCGG